MAVQARASREMFGCICLLAAPFAGSVTTLRCSPRNGITIPRRRAFASAACAIFPQQCECGKALVAPRFELAELTTKLMEMAGNRVQARIGNGYEGDEEYRGGG